MSSTLPAPDSGTATTSRSASIEFVVDQRVAASVRREIARVLQAGSVGDEARSDVELLVSELVSNVVRHEHAALITIEVAITVDGAVTVAVTGGIGEPSPELAHPAGRPALTRASGRGLFILDSLASTWGTQRATGMTTVWFTVKDADAGCRPDDTARVVGVPSQVPSTAAVAVLEEAEVIVEAVTVATAVHLIVEPEVIATRAASTAEAAAQAAAAKAAAAAQRARVARAAAATAAAASVAQAAARTVEAVQAQADELAAAVAAAAAEAARLVSSSIVPGGDAEAARAASQVWATVISTAVAKAEETARAAVLVARAVADTAAGVADTTSAAAAAMEHEVLDAAVALGVVTTATARELAAETLERGAVVALATREAVAATDRLHEANRQLHRAGQHDRNVALALQEAMLTRLPEPEDLQLAARYLTAAEQDQVGGDWYDAVVLPNGRTMLVIGDVIGHDIKAAAAMGQLRNILRALVWDRDEAPSAVLTRLDRAIRELHIDTIASVILLSIEPSPVREETGAATLRWSNAGHPAPVLIHVDGTAVGLQPTGDLLLGVQPDTSRRDHTHPIAPGATLLLYTDGLVETRTHGIDIGQLRLLEAARTHHRLEPGELLDAVLTDMVGGRPEDDVAVLAVRFQSTARTDRQTR